MAAGGSGPLAQSLSEIVAIPEATIEDSGEFLIPLLDLVGDEVEIVVIATEVGVDGLVVALYNGLDVFRSSRPSFDFEDTDTTVEHAVEKMYCLEVLGREDVFVINGKGDRGRGTHVGRVDVFGDVVSATADLQAFAPVGTLPMFVEAEVALAADGHAEGTVAEHLNAYEFSGRSAYMVTPDGVVDVTHLLHVEFTREDNDISKSGVETERFDIGDVELGTEVNFDPNAAGIGHGGNVTSDNSGDASLLCRVNDGAHLVKVGVVDDGVDSEVGFDMAFLTECGDVSQVVKGEVAAAVGTHVQSFDAEVDGVGTGAQSGGKRLLAANGCHYFKVITCHVDKVRVICKDIFFSVRS